MPLPSEAFDRDAYTRESIVALHERLLRYEALLREVRPLLWGARAELGERIEEALE